MQSSVNFYSVNYISLSDVKLLTGCVSYQEEYLLNERRARSNGLQLVLNLCHLALLLHACFLENNDLLHGQNNPTEDQSLCLNGSV
jgi:hypothetical protein